MSSGIRLFTGYLLFFQVKWSLYQIPTLNKWWMAAQSFLHSSAVVFVMARVGDKLQKANSTLVLEQMQLL